MHLGSLTASVTIIPPPVGQRAIDGSVIIDAPAALDGEVTIVFDPAAVGGSPGVEPISVGHAFEIVTSGGIEIGADDRVSAAEVVHDTEGSALSFDEPAWRVVDGPGGETIERPLLGVITDYMGAPPPGTDTLSASMRLYGAGGTSANFDLFGKGRSTNAPREATTARGANDSTQQYQIKGQCYFRANATLQPPTGLGSIHLPYGHNEEMTGTRASDLCILVLLHAGIPEDCINIPPFGDVLMERLDLPCNTVALSWVRDVLADSQGYNIHDDRLGRITASHMAPVTLEPVSGMTYDKVQITTADVTVAGPAPDSVPVCITVKGSAAAPADGEGFHDEVTCVEEYDTFSILRAETLQQASTGELIAVSRPGPGELKFQRKRKTVTTYYRYGPCVILTVTLVWEWVKRECARYHAYADPPYDYLDGSPYGYDPLGPGDQVYLYAKVRRKTTRQPHMPISKNGGEWRGFPSSSLSATIWSSARPKSSSTKMGSRSTWGAPAP